MDINITGRMRVATLIAVAVRITAVSCQRCLLVFLMAALPPGIAQAHTISIGYENSGNYKLTFWYGSYHGGGATEGDIRLVGEGLDEQGAFDKLVSGKPAGLEDGRTNFFSCNGQNSLVDNNCYGSPVDWWQGREFSVTKPGDYTFTYIPIPNPTQNWEPINNAILSSTLSVITADLDTAAPTIGTGQLEDESWAPGDPIIFEGGTLALTGDTTINRVISLDDDGGTIDTNGSDLHYTGDMDGRGLLTKTGAGTLYMNGTNASRGGMALNGGAVNVDSDGQLGAAGADLRFDGGTLQFGSSFNIDNGRDITLNNGGGTFDTQAHDTTVTQAITGTGGLSKTGSGTLTLSGNNTFNGNLEIDRGTVSVGSDSNMGNGDVVIGDGTLQFSSGITSNRNIRLDSGNAGIDAGAHNLTLAGSLSGTGTLNKTGSGTMTLSGNNSHNGINLDEGELDVTSAAALGSNTGTLQLAAGTQLNLQNDMTVEQSVQIAGNNAKFNTGNHNVTLNGSTSGTACLTKSGTGVLDMRADGSNAIGACVEEGGLRFNARFDGDVWVHANGTAGGSGIINGDVEVSGVFSPGNSPGITTVNGSVTQTAGSTLEIEIDGPAPGNGAGFHDQLRLVGANSVFTAAGALDVKFRGISAPANNDYTPEIGEAFTIVTAEGGIQGRFDTFAQPGAGLPANARLDIGYLANAIVLGVTPESYSPIVQGLVTTNGRALATLTDDIRQPAGGYDSSAPGRFQGGLIGLSSGELATAFEQAAGEIHANTLDAVSRSHRTVRTTVRQRLTGAGIRGRAAGEVRERESDTGYRWWNSYIGNFGHVDGDRHARSYRTDTYSMIFGLEDEFTETLSGGVALGYSRTETDAGLLGTGRANTYQALAYGKWQPDENYIIGIIAAGADRHDIDRAVNLSSGAETVNSKPLGGFASADVEAGRSMQFDRVRVTPAVGLTYSRQDREGVTEQGSSAVALDFAHESRDSLEVRAGAYVDTDFTVRRATVRPYLSAFAVHELLDETSVMKPSLHGEKFTLRAPAAGRTRAELGAGVRVAVSERASFHVDTRADKSEDAFSYSVNAGVEVNW